MKELFITGMALGVLVGAVVVTNNKDAKMLVEKGKRNIKRAIDEISE